MTAILLVGATGTLGGRIADRLLANGDSDVRLLVRDATPADQSKAAVLTGFADRGATLVEGNLNDPPSLDVATRGINVVISAVQGGRDTIVDGQVALARAAKASGAYRFIPSDFALNIWQAPQDAPMFALRREADAAIDQLGGLDVIHVLNGAFMDMMLDPHTAGVVDLDGGTGNIYGDGSDEFDITLIDDVAAFTARIATDESAGAGIYPISGTRTSFNEIIAEVERVSGRTLIRNHRGSIEDLQTAVAEASNPWSVIGQWYNYAMLTTPPFAITENERYADVPLTSLRDHLLRALGTSS